ncbi:hypothetical protein ES319_D10G159200v1 [Gossypium barbadense]|uniref:Amino acid transporter transmembrane domain-containing protein n=3 Tax=Gossypium TaxID=3633 RepID=A0A5J5PSC4_GOSBA|nr:hypothetical protein ES319_D10G159200v1 [Gossypium barbadense]PPE01161.1 hypothetical protein GOBAR_DD01804 [Gossypium barbadense]TYG50371.1 hypothetical protein ES288_D10G169900v1 [Gossypium darwinii]TYH49973.1 hypothetical protein ES332_D10G172800v1 [Gossypium tomentosum]
MLGKLRKSVAKLPFHESNLALKQVKCDACIEENGVCKCDNGGIEGMVMTEDAAGQQARSGNSSFLHAVLNMSGMLIGLGQLSTPYALENGGWGSVFLLVGLGFICTYTSHVLGKCLDKNPKSESFADIGENAFGRKGRVLTATFIYIEIFMALVSYTISLHDNLITVLSRTQIKLPGVPNLHTSQLITVVAVLIALPSLWLRDLSSVSFLSSGGILMSLVIFISVVCTAAFGSVEANHSIPFLHVKNIPAISGLYIYSYAGHFVFPNLYKAMKDPSKFTKVSIVSFAACTLLYTALAFLGAKMFGPEVNPQITLSLPRHHFITKIALWATVLTPMTKYALEFAPFAIQLENNLPDSLSSRMKLIIRGFVGSILLLVILSLALSVPYFEHVLSLTGSLVSVCICMTFPSAFYIKLSWPHISKPVLILNLFLIAFGSILGVLGIISSAKMLIKTLLRARST